MAPQGCHASSATLRACKNAYLTANPPSLTPPSGKSNLQTLAALFTEGLPTFQLGSDTFSAATHPSSPSKRYVMPGMAMSYDKDEDTIKNTPSPFSHVGGTQIATFVVIGVVATILASAIILSNIRYWLKKRKEKKTHIPQSNHDWEYRSQDRVNKSLRWKTLKKWRDLKKWCALKTGAGAVVREVKVVPKEKVGMGFENVGLGGEKKDAADVEALKGVTIRPMPV